MSTEKCRHIFLRLSSQNPEPRTELCYQSHFELLIAVILSAQATDVSVNKATKALFAAASTPEAMLALGQANLEGYIQQIGLYRSKARHILATCQRLIEQHQSRVPSTRAELEALPGVGRKTANVVLNTAFKQKTIAVDTHIFRVANRTGMAAGKTVRLVEENLMRCVPPEYLEGAHHWLILHGRYICKARKPLCYCCIIKELCDYYKITPVSKKENP